MSDLTVNCVNNDLTAEALVRLVIVDSAGEPYFDSCDKATITNEDLIRLLIGVDEFGNDALRVAVI